MFKKEKHLLYKVKTKSKQIVRLFLLDSLYIIKHLDHFRTFLIFKQDAFRIYLNFRKKFPLEIIESSISTYKTSNDDNDGFIYYTIPKTLKKKKEPDDKHRLLFVDLANVEDKIEKVNKFYSWVEAISQDKVPHKISEEVEAKRKSFEQILCKSDDIRINQNFEEPHTKNFENLSTKNFEKPFYESFEEPLNISISPYSNKDCAEIEKKKHGSLKNPAKDYKKILTFVNVYRPGMSGGSLYSIQQAEKLFKTLENTEKTSQLDSSDSVETSKLNTSNKKSNTSNTNSNKRGAPTLSQPVQKKIKFNDQ